MNTETQLQLLRNLVAEDDPVSDAWVLYRAIVEIKLARKFKEEVKRLLS